MDRTRLTQLALAAAAVFAASPAAAQENAPSVDPSGVREFMPGRSSNARNVICTASQSNDGVSYQYRGSFRVENNLLASGNERGFATATAYETPASQTLGEGVSAVSAGKPGLVQSTLLSADWRKDFATSYTLSLTLDLPTASEQPLISHVFFNGKPIWYQGLHQTKSGSTRYRIERIDRLERGALPPQGQLDFVFERGGVRVAELSFDTSRLAAREFATATTEQLINRMYLDSPMNGADCQ